MDNKERFANIMKVAASGGTVIPAFNIPYLPMVEPTIKALEKYDTFGLIEVARLEITKFKAGSLGDVAAEFNRWANPRVCSLHLDHVPIIDEDGLLVDWKSMISEGIALGYNSVMVDGSRLPLDENIALTAEVVGMAHPHNVKVEAELGAVMGHSDGPMPDYDEIFENQIGFTRPDEAARFVRETGVDWLSVSIGSFHGNISAVNKDKPKLAAKLDIALLQEIRKATGIPLVLHGGSGVQQSYVNEAIANGMVKVNIGTDTRQPYERVITRGGSIQEAQNAVMAKIAELICNIYNIQGTATKLEREVSELK